MKKKYVKAIAAALIITMLSGCGNGAFPNSDGGVASKDNIYSNEPESGAVGQQAPGGGGDPSAESGAGNGASQASGGKPELPDTGSPVVYETEELYTQKENILSLADSAAVWGISYKIEKVEYTESFGNRNLEHLQNYMEEVKADGQGNLSGDFKYLFLTITFTNTTDEFQEINRNAGGITLIGSSLNTLTWSNDVVYYDTCWEEGNSQQLHHWELEPGESVTSEVGWIIEDCKRAIGMDDTLAERMGSEGPYELYYHVKQFDSDNIGSYFIDLGVKVE